jgi:hypothetical protein
MVVVGEGGGEPDGHLLQWYVGVGVVSWGEEVSSIAGESLPLCPFHVRGPGAMYEPDEFQLDLDPVVIGDVEAGCLPMVLFKSFRTDSDSGVVAVIAAAAVVSAAAVSSWGLVFFIMLDLLEPIFCPGSAPFSVICFVHRVVETSVEESEG